VLRISIVKPGRGCRVCAHGSYSTRRLQQFLQGGGTPSTIISVSSPPFSFPPLPFPPFLSLPSSPCLSHLIQLWCLRSAVNPAAKPFHSSAEYKYVNVSGSVAVFGVAVCRSAVAGAPPMSKFAGSRNAGSRNAWLGSFAARSPWVGRGVYRPSPYSTTRLVPFPAARRHAYVSIYN